MENELTKDTGHAHGIDPGLLLHEKCKAYWIEELSIYCFIKDNTKLPAIQRQAFSEACVAFAFEIARRGAALYVVGDENSLQFPKELREFRQRQGAGWRFELIHLNRLFVERQKVLEQMRALRCMVKAECALTLSLNSIIKPWWWEPMPSINGKSRHIILNDWWEVKPSKSITWQQYQIFKILSAE